MGHIIAPGIGTSNLETFGGLVTNCNASDLPEGASPRCWDVDFIIGSVFTRPGLQSVYSFTNVIVITRVIILYGVATFTYVGTDPLVNESFLLSGFTGAASFLNGFTVTVIAVNTVLKTFTAAVAHSDITLTGLAGSAASTTGEFVGPNVGGLVTVVPSSGSVWVSPTSLVDPLLYASVDTGSTTVLAKVPANVGNLTNTLPEWANPSNAMLTGAPVTTVTLSPNTVSSPLQFEQIGFSLPADAVVQGLSISFFAKGTGSAGQSSLNISLTLNGTAIGTPVNIPISTIMSGYVQGSPSYQWGTSLTPAVINGNPFIVSVQAAQNSSSSTFSLNGFEVTVYYTTSNSSESLDATVFAFSIPATSGISGFGVGFEAYSTAATTLTFQLLKAGFPVGTPHIQVLDTVADTAYLVGNALDLWGDIWTFANVNNVNFGVRVTASGSGTTFIRDLDIIVYATIGLSNFNYIKSYVQNDGNIDTLALDASGIMWDENVNALPNVLAISLTGILPGTFAQSATALDREYIMFSDLAIGTERPRKFDGSIYTPVSQVGPGAPPAVEQSSGLSGDTVLTITAFSITGNVVTFTYTSVTPVVADQIYSITGAVPTYLNFTGVVLGVPAPSPVAFSMELTHANVALTTISPSATGTLQFNYPIASITQFPSKSADDGTGGHFFWGAGAGPTHTPGSNFVIYYSQTEDTTLTKYFAAHPDSTYVYLANINNFPQFSQKTYLVTAVGHAFPSGSAGAARFYFMVNVGVSGASYPDLTGPPGTYQQTIATITTSAAVPGLNTGDTIQITGETPTAWNATWSIVSALKSSNLNITATTMSATGVATYSYSVPAGGVAPVNGQIATITQCNNSAAGYTTSPFNTTGVISGVTGSTFNITGFTAGHPVPPNAESPNGIAQTFGTQFTIDPGAGAAISGSNINPIFGNAGASSAGTGIFIVGSSSATAITPGTRQAVVFFITESGYETFPSPPIVFTLPANTTSIHVTNIPIGPPNVIKRGIAFTEAGQNGIPGANFYVIPNDVVVQVPNGAPILYTATIVNDNISTSAIFTFTDAVLLNSTAIDVQGNDLFNLIELGSSAWCVPYASRMFYGLQLSKVDNFINMPFDGGHLPTATGSNLLPLGWQVAASTEDVTLTVSPVTGNALYINNTTGGTLPNAGLIFQTAYQDVYKVPIINVNTTYSYRVAARNPSLNNGGTLSISLTGYNPAGVGAASQFFPVYGSATIPLTSMSTNMQVFTGTLLTTPFTGTGGVPANLVLVVQVLDLLPGADAELDRLEVFTTLAPYIKAQVYGSYVNNLEAIDASGSGGILDTSGENAQDCMGGFVMHDTLYLLKTDSMCSTEDNPNSEPGGWGVHEVSTRVGTIGIHSYDTGEDWLLTACRAGIYGFEGGAPVPIMREIYELWDRINWRYGNTIWLRNDIVNKRILCAIPLPTGTSPEGVPTKTVKWLPNAPYSPNPTSPNVMLVCNYQGLTTFSTLMGGDGVHQTMFGVLAASDGQRKWSIWQIPSPAADFIVRQEVEQKPLFICNGINSEKIYQLLQEQYSDDGVAINGLYTTYGHVDAAKAATVPIFGSHAKRYTVLQVNTEGAGVEQVRVLQNTLDARYPYTVPGGLELSTVENDDFFRPLNIRAQRAFLEFSTNAVGSWFNLSRVLLSGKADNFTLNKTGGGQRGYPST